MAHPPSPITAEFLIACVTTLGAVIVAYIQSKKAKDKDKKLKEKEKEVETAQIEVIATRKSFEAFVRTWSGVVFQINRLINDTEIDRFLILHATNGKTPLKKTTAIYQIREAGQQVFSYQDIELDDHYRNMLRHIEKHGHYYFVVDNEPDCLLKRIYVLERVKSSYLKLIEIVENEHVKIINYASYASHISGEITLNTRTLCDMTNSKLSGSVEEINKVSI